jgi:hypothetical protein
MIEDKDWIKAQHFLMKVWSVYVKCNDIQKTENFWLHREKMLCNNTG